MATTIQCGSGGRGRPLRRRPQIEVSVGDAWRRNAEDGRDDEGDRDSEQERIDWRQRRCRQAGEDAGRVEPIGRSVTIVMVRAIGMRMIARWHDHVRHGVRSEEHTSELQSLMRISYAVFCLKKKKK